MYPKDLVSQHLAPLNLPRQQAVADDADGDILEATLLQMSEHEEIMNGFPCSPTMSQVLSGNEHGPPVISGSHLQNLRPNYAWVPDEDDFLEENDLVSLDDEYLDREALPRPVAPSTQVPATVSALRGSHQVRMQPPSSGSLGGSSSRNCNNINRNPLVMNIEVSVSVRSGYIEGLNHTHPTAAVASVEELRNVGTSKEQGSQRRSKRGRSSLQLEGRSSKAPRRLA